MEFTVDKASFEDLPDIKRLYEQLIDRSEDLGSMRNRYAEILKDERILILVARDMSGKTVGCLNGYICPIICWDCSSFMVVEDVIVDKEHRNCGIGKALMDSLDDFAERNGCVYSILVSTDKETRKDAHKFYKKMGYNEYQDVKGFRKIYKNGPIMVRFGDADE